MKPTASENFSTSTQWTVVYHATDKNSEKWKESVDRLISRYQRPLVAYAVQLCRNTQPVIDAEDLVQDFFTENMLVKELRFARIEGKRFRDFLRTCLKRHFLRRYRDLHTKKRGGSYLTMSLDFEDDRAALEPSHSRTADVIYERAWAKTLMESATARLREFLDKADWCADVELYLQLPMANSPNELLQSLPERITPGLARKHKSIVTKKFADYLREELKETLDSPSPTTIDEELRSTLALIATGPAE